MARFPIQGLGFPLFRRVGWALLTSSAVFFFLAYAVRYFGFTKHAYGPYFWPKRWPLLLHVIGGSLALGTGIFQLWTGHNQHRLNAHRLTGKVYVIGVIAGVLGAGLLIPSVASVDWGFAYATAWLAVVWAATTGIACYAIGKRNIQQHREWMTRSYVVTFSFVMFRLLNDYLPGVVPLTGPDRWESVMWTCWVGPLFLAEVCMQLRKT